MKKKKKISTIKQMNQVKKYFGVYAEPLSNLVKIEGTYKQLSNLYEPSKFDPGKSVANRRYPVKTLDKAEYYAKIKSS